ncbi:MAG: PDDEXK nuclease domain-containing protein [Verrucomicrobiae bacterium]|nr:PDDEXK nuclease domain-containing protein [Verrucomicrobiae bacterium]
MNRPALILPRGYANWLVSIKQRIAGARQRALLSANAEQIRLYHDIGCDILERQNREGWGAKVIDHLSVDLRAAFPDMKGLSTRNLKYMAFFAKECPDMQFAQQTAAQIRQQTAAQLPWFHIVTLITKLPTPGLREWYARQAFKPEHAGQLNFYLNVVDDRIKAPDDRPTVGLLLCKTRKRLVAEYALSGIEKPIGVAEYQLVRALPKPLDTCLPAIEELENGLLRGFADEKDSELKNTFAKPDFIRKRRHLDSRFRAYAST